MSGEFGATVRWRHLANGTVASVELTRRITRQELEMLRALVREGGVLEGWLGKYGHREVDAGEDAPPAYLESAL